MSVYTNDADLEALYRLDNDLTDDSPNADDASPVGTPTYSTTTPPQGTHKMVVDGTNHATITDAASAIDFGLGAWTLCFWMDPDDAGGTTIRTLINKGSAADREFYWAIRGDDTRLSWATGAAASNTYTTTDNLFADDAQHWVCITWDGTTLRIYVDNVEDTSDDFPVTPGANCRASAQPFQLGPDTDFSGFVDEVVFFSRVLSSDDRGSIYSEGVLDAAGDVTVAPTAITSVASSVNPTVALGSVSVAPTAKTAVASSVNPTTILGNIAIAAAATVAVVVCVIAAVLLSSTVAAPTAINTVATVVAPTVLQGDLSVAPSVLTAVAAGVDPTVDVGGDISVAPPASTAAASSASPTVILGGVAIAPTARAAIASSTGPSVVQDSLTVSPTAQSGVVSSVNPTVVEGGITVTPTALSAIASTIAPTVLLSSTTASPAATTAIASSVSPTILQGSLALSPTATGAIASVVAPTVVESGITVTPSAQSAVASTVAPTVVQADMAIAPAARPAIATSAAPTILQGALSLTPAAGTAIASGADPTVATPTVVAPAVVSAIASSVAPTIAHGSLSITPSAQNTIASTVNPTVIASSVAVAPTATSVIASTIAPAVVQSSMTIAPAARSAVVSTVAPTVQSGTAVTPTAISAIASSIDPFVGPFGTLFNITHEVGDLSEYDSTATDSGDLSVTTAAKLVGTSYGLQVLIDDDSVIYGRKEIDLAVKQLRVRFYIDPNSLTMDSEEFLPVVRVWSSTILFPTGALFAYADLRYDGSSYEIRIFAWPDAGGAVSTAFYDITDAEHYVEFRLVRAASASSNDGTIDLWIDGDHKEQLASVDIYNRMTLDYIQMGACFFADAPNTSGTLYLDELNGNDTGVEIGPVPADIEVAPTAISAIASAVNPSVVLDSMTVAPTATSAVASAIDPTVLVGDTVITPSPITAAALTIAPTVVQASMAVAPASVTAVASSVAPTTVLGGITITPSVQGAIALTVSPTAVQASIAITPAASTAIVTTTGPVVVVSGDVTVAPTASTAIASGIAPAVVLSSVSVTPTTVGAVASSINPTIVEGGLSIAPTATSAIASSIAPTIILGSATVAPATTAVIASTVAPTVVLGGDVAVTPSAISAIATTAAPTITQGSLGIAPAARTVIASTVSPTVITPTVVAPTAVSAIASSAGPSAILYGSVTIAPSAIHAVATGVDPIVYAGAAAWSYTGGGRLQGVGGGGTEWHGLLSQNSMPEAGHITFDKFDTRGAVLIRATAKDTGYLVYWDADSVGISYLDGGTETNLIDLPKIYGGNSSVEVAWREVQYTQDDPYRWLFITGYFDGELAVTYGDNIADKSIGNKVGFAVYGGDTITFDNICVPKFAVIGDWASLDENEAPGGALSRLIGQRHVRMFLRYDGTLRVWKPCAVDSSRTFTNSLIENRVKIVDGRGLLSHVRVQGAFVSAETVDTDLLKAVGHRYARQDNPNLETEQECKDEAEYQLRRAEEDADLVELSFPMCVPLEPEDRITVPDGDYLITGVSFDGKSASLKASYKCRKYVT